MVKYLYDGELSPQMAEYIKGSMQKYPNVVELSDYPADDWLNANLPVYHWQEKSGTTGGTYPRSSQKFCWLSKKLDGKTGGFFFVTTAVEKQRIIEGCPHLIVNPNPFKTII